MDKANTLKVNPLISICIPTYNRTKFISEAIESVLNQTYRNIELIICDNKSTDNTWEIIQCYSRLDSRIKAFQNETNLGPVKNWQNGFDECEGEYFLILWSDDKLNPFFLEKTYSKFDVNTAFVIVGNSEFESVSSIEKTYPFEEISTKEFIEDIVLDNCNGFLPSPSIALFRRLDLVGNIIFNIENTDEIDFNRTGAGPDVLFFLFTALRYSKVRFVNEILLYNRVHEGSITYIENRLNGLKLSYDWAKYYFVKNFYSQLLPKYKSITLIRLIIYRFLHKSIWRNMKSTPIDIKYLIKLFIYKIKK